MSWAAPWFLLGLLLLPLIWWLHKRLRRPPQVVLPSLMFLHDEAEARTLPRGQRFDVELVLALAAALLLAFAAAGPTVIQRPEQRVVRVAISGGAPATATGYRERADAAVREIQRGLGSEDVLHVEWVPQVPARESQLPRPGLDALLGAVRAGEAAVRIVLSDLAPPEEDGGVTWVGIGAPAQAANVAIVAASIQRPAADAGMSVFFTVANFGADPVRLQPSVVQEGRRLALAARTLAGGAMASTSVSVDGTPTELLLRAGAEGGDDLAADDEVRLVLRPLLVHIGEGLPAPLRARIRLGLTAALSESGLQFVSKQGAIGAHLVFVRRGAPIAGAGWHVLLQSTGEGDPVVHAPAGIDPRGRDPIVRDLSAAGADWVYALGAQAPDEGEILLLHRRAKAPWPIVLQRGKAIRLAPDPMRGAPAPVDTPFWPMWIDNLVSVAGGGEGVGGGYRAHGLLDPESSQLGAFRSPFPAEVIAAAPATVAARGRPLRPLLIGAALACLGLLWVAPRFRRRIGRSRLKSAKAHASAA